MDKSTACPCQISKLKEEKEPLLLFQCTDHHWHNLEKDNEGSVLMYFNRCFHADDENIFLEI